MTFAVQGPTSNPQVIVNPLSLVAPGIFREMFQMTTADPKVQVRGAENAPVWSAPQPAYSSPAPSKSTAKSKSKANTKKKTGSAQRKSIDGWSSTTSPAH
jgi:hypothetical protein